MEHAARNLIAAGRFSRLLVIGCALALIWCIQTSPASADDASTTAAARQLRIDESARFRTEFGLSRDAAFIEQRLNDSLDRSARYGVPLLPSEEQLMLLRLDAQNELEAVNEYGRRHSDTYAGRWIEYPDGATLGHLFTVKVAFTDDPSAHAAEVGRLTSANTDLRLVQLKYSEAALGAIVERMRTDDAWFTELGTSFYQAVTRTPENRVELYLSRVDDAIEKAIADRYGADVVAVKAGSPPGPDACTRANCGPPWIGGLNIIREVNLNRCTSGFVVVLGGNFGVFTSGHCGNGTWYNYSVSAGNLLGTTKAGTNFFIDGSPADVQVIDVNDPIANWDNLIIADSASCNPCLLRGITSSQAFNGDGAGDQVCNSGYASGLRCGTILSTNSALTYLGVDLVEQRVATYVRAGGDSGGPVHNGSKAIGSHTHFDANGNAVYSHIQRMVDRTRHTVVLSGGCNCG